MLTINTTYSYIVKMTSPEHHSLAASISSNAEPSTAARALTAPAEEIFSGAASEANIEGGLRRVWEAILDIAADTEHKSQQPLIAIVQAVQQQNFPSDVTIWGEKVRVWGDLPLFGACVRDAWNRGAINPTHKFSRR